MDEEIINSLQFVELEALLNHELFDSLFTFRNVIDLNPNNAYFDFVPGNALQYLYEWIRIKL